MVLLPQICGEEHQFDEPKLIQDWTKNLKEKCKGDLITFFYLKETLAPYADRVRECVHCSTVEFVKEDLPVK